MKTSIYQLAHKINEISGGRLSDIETVNRLYKDILFIYDNNISDDVVKKFIISKTSGKEYWDVGAHTGFFALNASSYAEKVRAFEPDPDNFEQLSENSCGKTNIEIYNIAVSDTNGKTKLFKSESGSLKSSLAKDDRLGSSCIVETQTVDSLVAEYGEPDFIKIDVEGAEQRIIDGAEETLRDSSVHWFIEIHSPRTGERINRIAQHGDSVNRLYESLLDKGYNIYGFNPQKNNKLFEFSIDKYSIPLYWYASKSEV